MRRIIVTGISIIAFTAMIGLSGCIVRKDSSDMGITGDYLGQMPPGMTAEVFAPSIVSTGRFERDAAFTPDAREFYFTILLPSSEGVIMVIDKRENRWIRPRVAAFSGMYSDMEPCLAPGGKRLYFTSNRPLPGGTEAKDFDIWYVDRSDTGWMAPVNLGSPVNTDKNEFYPSVSANGSIYFTAEYDGNEDIYLARRGENGFEQPVRLPDEINTPSYEFNAYVSPDEGYLIYSSIGRSDGIGGGDMYINYRLADGAWSEAINMGAAVNSTALDYSPSLSPDGRYLFFTSRRKLLGQDEMPFQYLADIIAFLNRPQNGDGDLYWIDSRIIDDLRP